MTKERLLEAIKAHDPDGQGLERVLKAAEVSKGGYFTDGMYRWSSTSCPLARAWKARITHRIAYCKDDRGQFEHKYEDVIVWFDQQERLEEILEMFKDEIQASH